MKKYMVWCAGLGLAMTFTGCKSNESAYRKAYDKAKAAEAAQTQVVENTIPVTETPVVTPVQTRPVQQTPVVDNYDNVSVRREQVSLVNGSGLQDYSVVVASMKMQDNAEGLQQRLKNAGYNAQVVKASIQGEAWYRVISGTYATKAEAAQSRNAIRGTQFNPNSDAWLLFNVK